MVEFLAGPEGWRPPVPVIGRRGRSEERSSLVPERSIGNLYPDGGHVVAGRPVRASGQSWATWANSNSTGVSRPKMLTNTLTLS